MKKLFKVQSESITRASIVISISTFVSRLLGFLRQMLIAYYYGAKAITDAFFVANVLPGLFTSLIDSIPTVFVPVFLQEKEAHGEHRAWEGTRKVFGIVFLYLFFAFLLGIILTPYALRILVPGFEPKRYNLAVTMSYALLPLVFVYGMYGLLQSVYHVYRVFSLPNVMILLVNVSLITFLVLFNNNPVVSLAIGYVVSFGIYVFLLTIIAKKKWSNFGFDYSFRDPMIKKIFTLLIPIYLGSSLSYLNLFIDRVFASMLPEGSVSALNYATIVKDVPISLFAGPMSQVVYPATATQIAQGKLENARALVSRSLEAIWLFIIPTSLGFLILPEQTIRFVYERGLFNVTATTLTAQALFFYTLGTLANASVGVISRTFFSLNDTKTPVKVSAVALVLNIVLNSLLVKRYKHIGLALATSISSIVATILLFELLRRKLKSLNAKELLKNTIKIILASICIVPVLLIMSQKANTFFGYLTTVGISALIYSIALFILKPRSVEMIILKIKARFIK